MFREFAGKKDLFDNCYRTANWLIFIVVIGTIISPIQCRPNDINADPRGIDVAGYEVKYISIFVRSTNIFVT